MRRRPEPTRQLEGSPLRSPRYPDCFSTGRPPGDRQNCRPADTARVGYDAVVIEFPMLLNFEFSCWSAYSIRSWPPVSWKNFRINVVIEQGRAGRGRVMRWPPGAPTMHMAASRIVNSRVKTRL